MIPLRDIEAGKLALVESFDQETWPTKASQYGLAERVKLHGSTDLKYGILNELGSFAVAAEIFTTNTWIGVFIASLSTLGYWFYGSHLQVSHFCDE